MAVALVNVYRGDRLESRHTGSVAVVDAGGRLLAMAGDPSEATFLRSAAKPFQTIAMLEQGIGEEYDLSPEEIAIISGSHGGEAHHVAASAAILRKGGFDESDLLCAAHVPYDDRASLELRASGEAPSPLHNNCSGKHAGMILASRAMDAPTSGYLSAAHPLQQQIHRVLAEFAGIPVEEIATAVDGCGVPTFHLSLYRAALAYARLGEAASSESLRHFEAARDVTEAMTRFPGYVAGQWSMTTPLMESFGGALLAKEGAEGFYAMTILPPLGGSTVFDTDGAVGIAMKVHDGSMTRGRNPAILRVLDLLGLDTAMHPQLSPYRDGTVRNHAGTAVGSVRSEFELTFL